MTVFTDQKTGPQGARYQAPELVFEETRRGWFYCCDCDAGLPTPRNIPLAI